MSAITMSSAYHDHRTLTVTVSGDLDIASSDELAGVVEVFTRSQRANLILDVRDVPFIDAYAVRALVAVAQVAARRGGRLTVVGAAGPVLKVLTLTGMDAVCKLESAPGMLRAVS